MRILFLGTNWFGSCARACSAALRRMGHDVFDVDTQTFVPQWRQRSSRALIRLIFGVARREYNEQILDSATLYKPDLVIAFKGLLVTPETLRELRQRGIPTYNYYPDTSAFSHRDLIPESMGEYDHIFYTKRFWAEDVKRHGIQLRGSEYLAHGYDPELHRPLNLTEEDRHLFGSDAIFIATHTKAKEDILGELLAKWPTLNLRVWGGGWTERCRTQSVKKKVIGQPLYGNAYAKAIRASKVNLAILSGVVTGASSGDLTTTRTYEIPACGGFMLHERNTELAELFREGEEVACFASAEELADKIRYYLENETERTQIARRGFERCVPAYSYDSRAARILEVHSLRTDAGVLNRTAPHPPL